MCPRSRTETIKYVSNKNCMIWKLEHVSNTFVNDTSVKKNQKYIPMSIWDNLENILFVINQDVKYCFAK